MTTKLDKSGNRYLETGNLRLTFIDASKRAAKKDWAGQDVVRIQAYRGKGRSLHRGAEFPVGTAEAALGLVAALCALVRS